MPRMAVTALLMAALLAPRSAPAQTFNARRMAMGGVLLAGGGPGSDAANVAYRAVPAARTSVSSLTLPIGLIPFLGHLPTLDPNDSDFNVYELANTLYNPPWNLQLASPATPSNDIVVHLARNSLAVDLGDVADVFPHEHAVIGAITHGPGAGFGFHRLFVSMSPVVEYDNDLHLNAALDDALHGGAFAPNTDYTVYDKGRGQVAAGMNVGWAAPLMQQGTPRAAGGQGLYAGVRVKMLRGLAYADGDNAVGFTTSDTLFATDALDLHYTGTMHTAGPEGGRLGGGVDVGWVWLVGAAELGLGVNDIGTTLRWRVRETSAWKDSVTGAYDQQVTNPSMGMASRVPTTVNANVALPVGRWLVAADVMRGPNATTGHTGVETWFGPWALRAGGGFDANRLVQGSFGGGFRFGRIGVDLALASHSRNVTRARALEMGAGLALYH